jgi:hypothetical protein
MRSRSSSANSSTSGKSLPADNLQIFVAISGEKSEYISSPNDDASSAANTSRTAAIPLNVRPSNTISDVLDFLSASTTLPSDVRLLHSGHHLSPSSTVADLALQPAATLHILSPLRGGTAPTESSTTTPDMTATLPSVEEPPQITNSAATSGTSTPIPASTGTSTASTPARKSNKPRCAHPPCKAAAQPIVGDCGFCQKRFCGKHRMLESHACSGLEDAKQAERDRNREKLEGERTVMLRGI